MQFVRCDIDSLICSLDVCHDGWRYFQGYCYRKVSSCDSWNNGESQCATLGANLPSVHSQEENVFIQSLLSGENGWLGLSDINTEGTFVWSDGTRLNFTYWATRQPNNFRNEDCVHTLGSLQDYRYKWNDVNCSSCHKYSCKKGIDLILGSALCLKYNLLGLMVSLFAANSDYREGQF